MMLLRTHYRYKEATDGQDHAGAYVGSSVIFLDLSLRIMWSTFAGDLLTKT